MLVGVALRDGVEQVEVPEREVFHFPRGVVGFEEMTRYAMFQLETPLFLLQSVDDPHVGFVLLDPFLVDPLYAAELPAEDRALLGLGDGEQPVLLTIATLSTDGSPLTANLRAPVAINPSRMVGVQAILPDNRYQVRCPVTREFGGAPSSRGGAHSNGCVRSNGRGIRARSA